MHRIEKNKLPYLKDLIGIMKRSTRQKRKVKEKVKYW